MYIGATLKALRKAKKMKLIELAEISGIQIATLSRIEHERMVGTLESHLAIARALEVDVTQLYSKAMEDKTVVEHNKKSVQSEVFTFDEKTSYEMLTKNVMRKRMMPILLKIDNGGQTKKEQNAIGSERFIFVLDGKITVHVGQHQYSLMKNHSLYFEANIEHYIQNSGAKTARLISVVTPVSL